MGYNFKELKQNTDILAVIERYITLKKDGPHYKAPCPFHNEDSASFVVTPKKNMWKCFGCGKSGDVFDFLTNYGYTYKEAVALVSGSDPGIGVAFPVKKIDGNTKAPKIWKQAIPTHQPTEISHYRYGIPHFTWPYYNERGTIVSYDCRFDHTDGTKDVLPLTYCTDGSNGVWRWQGMDKPRTLSHLHLLKQYPDKPILIVEGRKTAEAAQRLLPTPIVMTWQGGGNAVKQTDWSVLDGRKVTVWQDNDYAGFHATCEISDAIKNIVALLRFVHNPENAQKGWDAADAEADGWNTEMTRDYIVKNAFDTPQVKEKAPNEKTDFIEIKLPQEHSPVTPADVSQRKQNNDGDIPNGILIDLPKATSDNKTTEIAAKGNNNLSQNNDGGYVESQNKTYSLDDNGHFRFLGFQANDGKINHCFYNLTNKTVIKMSASGMGKGAMLMELAPLDFWENYFQKKGDGFNHAAAVNYLITTSNRLGIFRQQNIRGRGAWIDQDRAIIHAGEYLIQDGKYLDLSGYKGKFIYEQGTGLGFNANNPLTASEAEGFLELVKMLKWERSINGYLLAGWCVIAPLCGALTWRPHIWITGGAGSGKTWVLNHILKPMLGDTSLRVQGSTSEAGLRQALRRDALPVVFDEAEGENKNDQDRMQSVLSLMRSASSEDGGNIIKGTSSSGADSYTIRSCFAFASIALQLSQQSDRTRITILSLDTPGHSELEELARKKHFDDLMFLQYNLVTPEYCQRMQARAIVNIKTIIKNAHTFAAAAASVLGQQRAGDQLGALLAGAYMLKSDKLVSYDFAIRWLSEADKDWSNERDLMETRDEKTLFSCIIESQVRVEGLFGTYNRTVGELIRIIMGFDNADEHCTEKSAEMSLRRFGIIVDKETVRLIISNTSRELIKSLEGTPWRRNHSTLLLRIPGAEKTKGNKRFGSGLQGRGVEIPISYFVE